jgi:hypothetical protein
MITEAAIFEFRSENSGASDMAIFDKKITRNNVLVTILKVLFFIRGKNRHFDDTTQL